MFLDFENLVESRSEQIKLFFIQLSLWLIFAKFLMDKFRIKGIEKRAMDDLNNRIVSIVHGLFTFVYATYHLFTEYPEYGSYNTNSQVFLLMASTSYFVQDLIICTHYKIADTSLYIHHSLAITGYMTGILSKQGATDGIQGIFYAEVSNFPMHVRGILRQLGKRYTKFYEVNELLYIFLYVISRGLFTPIFLVYPCTLSSTTHFIIKFICWGIFLQSVFFIREMVNILKRKKREYRERCKKNISYFWFNENPSIQMLDYWKNKQKKDKIF